ncbi:DUF421 domain-containing protein [Noviherbaspirillum massiliense]|uniref:DUF421 domain-containing protein n=1 Tax=Noviherbaspirillum massiliense TaxID=1465823 RepID=UPI0002EC04D5|nr:YetF domain-containing protein [Noviherbaspirillum massiliense]
MLSIDWGELFRLSVPLPELLVRGTVMYWFLFLLFRFFVSRGVGEVGISDILIMVIVADAAQNAMAGEYKSITDGMILVATLVGWNVAFDWLSYHFSVFRRFAAPPPLRLVKDGKMQRGNMRRQYISEAELMVKLREAGVEDIREVKSAYLEPTGEISVIKK